jgi:hypothetical protein
LGETIKMNAEKSFSGVAIRCGLVSGLILVGGMLAGLLAGFAVNGLPMHVPEQTKNLLSALPVLAIITAAGAGWGLAMARLTGIAESRRMTWAGALCFSPSILAAGIALSLLEVAIVERGGGSDLPVHQVFSLLFVPATFCVAGIGGLAMGLAAKDWALAFKLFLASGFAGGLAFLAVNLVMDALGWRVGAPGAAERATMLTVTMAGSLAAAVVGGAVIGVLLGRYAKQAAHAPAQPVHIEVEAALVTEG